MDVYMLPFVNGTEVWVTQGNNSSYSHYGKASYAFDFSLGSTTEGTMLLAAAGGVVAKIKEDTTDEICGGEGYAAKGNHLVIRHDDGFCDLYVHLKHASVSEFGLRTGTPVARGQPIARVGKTGYTNCRAHLHLQRQYNGDSYWQQSVPLVFADVPGDGVPKQGQRYISGNELEQPTSLKESLEEVAAQQAAALLQPAQAFQYSAQQWSLGAPLSGVSRLIAPDSRHYFVQVFEGDTLYVHVAVPRSQIDWSDVRKMSTLLVQNQTDEWGLTLWRHTYANAGVEYRPSWSSHQFALSQLTTKPLGAPLGGGSSNGVHVVTADGKRYEAEVYAYDAIYWAPPNWGDIRRLSEIQG